MDRDVPESSVVILYTTLYREGGAKFAKAAEILAQEKRAEFPDCRIVSAAVESKAAFIAELGKVGESGGRIRELHFIGHSGMYGIMFGTRQWPEQMSPFEWRKLTIPFEPGARAYFRACRTARWFAPFFARTFGVKSFGYFHYTTVSRRPDRFAWDAWSGADDPAFIISVPGRKSHGLAGTMQKHLLRPKTYPLLAFEPGAEAVDTTYDAVAPLYDETFEDIAVRKDELRWLRENLAQIPRGRVLDLGCGTGSFLRAITDLIDEGVGVDLSPAMIEQARKRSGHDPKISFERVNGPELLFADESFDVVISVLSFRYLDWDPIVKEILRILKPGGRLLVIDMVAAPLKLREIPLVARDKFRQQLNEARHPAYRRALKKMVADPRWQKMLEYNPMRADHELRWYLESRFPGGKLEVINYGRHSRILAFLSPPLRQKSVEPLSYP